MKLTKQEKLFFQDAKSDKVYEVDLCEVDTDQYLVNFRYGKRGGNLKDGTKTKSPVSLEKAEAIFDKLVLDKTKKGYSSAVGSSTTTPKKEKKASAKKSSVKLEPFSIDKMKANLLEQLEKGVASTKNTISQGEQYAYGKKTKKGFLRGGKTNLGLVKTPDQVGIKTEDNRYLARVIWRIGEVRIPEAVPHLLKVKTSTAIIDAYTMAWALGRCAAKGDKKAIAYLEGIIDDKDQTASAKMLAKEAKMALLSPEEKKEYAKEIYEALPKSFQHPVRNDNADSLLHIINRKLNSKKLVYDEIANLYLLSSGLPSVRTTLVKWIKAASMSGGGYFKSIRQLFKAAEFRDDISMYGLLAYRITAADKSFAKNSASDKVPVTTFHPNETNYWRRYQTKYYEYSKEIKKPTSALGFSSSTRRYLDRRIWRYLSNKAALGDMDYIKMSVAFLMHFTDEDRKEESAYSANSTELGKCWALNKILFSDSKRIAFEGNVAKYVVNKKTPDSKANRNAPPKTREEAHSKMWDALPQAALHLIAESHCKEVNEFALKVINEHLNTLLPMIDLNLILALLGKKHEKSTEFGLALASKRYNGKTADFTLINTLLNSPLKKARAKGMEWLAENKKALFAKEHFVADMLFSPFKEMPKLFGDMLQKHKFSKEENISIVNRALGTMSEMPENIDSEEEKQQSVKNAVNLINAHFIKTMPDADPFKIEAIMRHNYQPIYVFGGNILLLDSMKVTSLPADVILKFFNNSYYESSVRTLGINLINKMDVDEIEERVFREMVRSYHDTVKKAGVALLNKADINRLSNEILLYLLDFDRWRDREKMNKLALILMKKLSNEQVKERKDLIYKLIQSDHEKARKQAIDWVAVNQRHFFSDKGFVQLSLFLKHEKMYKALEKAYNNYSFDQEQAAEIVEKSIDRMLAYKQKKIRHNERISVINAGELLTKYFGSVLKDTNLENIELLLEHNVPEVNLFGAKILLLEEMDISKLPESFMTNLIMGDSAEMRKVGMTLLGKMPEEYLTSRKSFVKKLCLSKHEEVRKAVKPIIKRLVKSDKQFGQDFTQEIALILLRREIYDGVDEDISAMLEKELKNYLPAIETRRVLQLIHSPRKAANILGNRLLQKNLKESDLKMRQIVRLASHEMFPIRKWAWNIYNKNVARVKYELKESVRILDASWDDSRDFAFDYFRKNLKEKDWEAEVLISICDSVNPLVQQFGKELITKFFKEENGEQYLLQLSQHPTADLQSFATNYLEKYASDKPEHIEKLDLYFVTVLSGVNKSSVAKERIYNFLRKEGLKNEKTAKIVSKILKRQSAMMTVRDKAKCVQIMRDLDKIYGNLDISFVHNDIPVSPTKREKVN